MNCTCPLRTRQGLLKISSVGSGSGFFSSSFFSSFLSAASLLASPLASSAFASFGAGFSPKGGACGSSTSIISLPRSLCAATDSVAAEPTTVVPGVAATETMSAPRTEDAAPSATEPPMEALSSMSTSALDGAFFSSFASFSFFSLSCLALAAVERTAVAAFAVSSFFGGCMGSGYAKSDGLAPLRTEKFLGIFSLSVMPIKAVGVRVSENMWIKGNQYHI
mmetsp:Transcript_125199/g.176728  ORF Transcript_125199/g.176728 Transcript_125199/m.176728 type:complete len:221 (-) Transcript_125199:1053-1715(-)